MSNINNPPSYVRSYPIFNGVNFGTFLCTGAITAESTLAVTGATTLASTLAVTGATSLNGSVTLFSSNAGNTLRVTKNTYVQDVSVTETVPTGTTGGTIYHFTSTLGAGLEESFTVTNTIVSLEDLVLVSVSGYDGTLVTNGIPFASVSNVAAGSYVITISNLHAANALAGVVKVSFLVVKLV
jgi:hypothetical protein